MGMTAPLFVHFRSAAIGCLLAMIPLAGAGTALGQAPAPRVVFSGSVRAVPPDRATAGAATRHAHLLRSSLRADETGAAVTFEVALRMHNFADLQARLARGELVPRAELAATYYPSSADYARVVAWVQSQGLTVTRTDANHLAVFGRGSVAAVAQAFQVQFGRVAADDGEYTSALTAPSLPAAVADAVLGVHGLQPHLHFEHRLRPGQIHPALTPALQSGYYPSQIASHYKAASTGLNGSGQTIAILSAAFPVNTDLTSFWSTVGVADSVQNIKDIVVGTGPQSGDTSSETEAALDVQWASALAPSASIRVYGANFNDPNFFDEILQQIAADLPAVPSMNELSISYGGSEVGTDRDYVLILSQYLANLASAGVSTFCASGDSGALQNGVYQVSVPTSDPNVTGVGGTLLDLTNNVETGWSSSGGGPSEVFSRPSWQTGSGVPAGTMRLVPDVAAVADASPGAYVVFGGTAETVTGTSWATPVWAAFCALLNQSRANAGLGPMGNFNARIYPFLGSACFTDITYGNNGYAAGAGYDMVTGLGVPNVAQLVQTALTASAAPAIYSQLGSPAVTQGQSATLNVFATGTPTLSYQWQREAAGTSNWSNLSDNSTYTGSATPMLIVNGTTFAMSGDQFQCVVANAAGSAVSNPVSTLTVSATGVTTLAGWPMLWGNVDGTGRSAKFEFPGSIREDASGNLYVADPNADTIRKVTQAGVVTTFAGTGGVAGSADGPAASALFNGPAGVAIDAAGNVYVADNGNYTIRKISPQGLVSTLAGSPGVEGSSDGSETQAHFTDPEDLCVDASGNLYVADGTGGRIRKVAPNGTVSTLTLTNVALSDPVGITIDASNNLYVADASANVIVKYNAAGAGTVYAGLYNLSGNSDGPSASARFSNPAGVALDAVGNVYVADTGNDTIRVISTAGVVSTVAGMAGASENIDGSTTSARFFTPAQVVADPGGALFVADGGNGTIRRIVPGFESPPQISSGPTAVTVNAGQNATYTVTAVGSAPLVYQWQQLLSGATAWTNLTDGSQFSGSATATLTVLATTGSEYGSQYQCVVSNVAGNATSAAAALTVLGPPYVPPVPFVNGSAAPGTSRTLAITALGSGLTYQWYLGSNPISGATGPTYTISNFGSANTGEYEVVVSNTYGGVQVSVESLSLQLARLVNLSALASSTPGGGVLTAGFILGGSGSKSILLRGIGPALGTAPFNLPGVLPDPKLLWFNAGSSLLDQNQGWGGTTALMQAFAASGAFSLSPSSADSALLETAPLGAYSIQVAGASGDAGTALAEIYDLDAIGAPARLINLSSRSTVTGSSNVLTAGFVIGGSGTETVLIRGVGPTLANYGVTNPLSNPVITLFQAGSSTALQTNAGWGNAANLRAAFSQVGAFPLLAGSNDAAMLVTLPAGDYSVQVSGANGSSGVALVEVYEVLY